MSDRAALLATAGRVGASGRTTGAARFTTVHPILLKLRPMTRHRKSSDYRLPQCPEGQDPKCVRSYWQCISVDAENG
jgi:hypothetical protein